MNQKFTAKLVYHLTMLRSKAMMRRELGAKPWQEFKQRSDARFRELMGEFESIGDSMFAFNYAYAPAYVAWYTALEAIGVAPHERDVWMLRMTERLILLMPKRLLRAMGKLYFRNMSRQACETQRRRQESRTPLHPFDWDIDYRRIDDDNFEIDFKTCGFIRYTRKYGAEGMLPGICQTDYMVANLLGVGFERTQTLAAGGRMCDCKCNIGGSCPFDMEERLAQRR